MSFYVKECAVSTKPTDYTPEFDSRFTLIRDKINGDYMKGEHITGNIYFLIGHDD